MPEESPSVTCVWDFYGPHSGGTAEHFLKHVGEFLKKNGLTALESTMKQLDPNHACARLTVESAQEDAIVKALRPHRLLKP